MRSTTDEQKLQMAGFTILRIDEQGLRLKEFKSHGSWITWKTFKTKAELNREVKRIDQVELKIVIE